jgi:hypothetical protein
VADGVPGEKGWEGGEMMVAKGLQRMCKRDAEALLVASGFPTICQHWHKKNAAAWNEQTCSPSEPLTAAAERLKVG